MSDATTGARPLSVLRGELDALDRDILELLARRQAIVAEVAGTKRMTGAPIRDLARERGLLEDRKAQARTLGLPAGTVESVWRLLMMASREHQAALRTEMPVEVAPKRIAIVGGSGGMGQALTRLFGDLGHEVLVADLDTTLRPVEAAKSADVVVVSVPIRATADVIREIGPHVRDDALLMDITSLKQAPIEAMLASTRASVVGTHPMFGPCVHTFTGQRVVLCRARGDAWFDWVAKTLAARGLVTTEAEAKQHDRAMSVVQVLLHYQTQVLGLTLSRLDVSLDETLAFTSPAYLLEAYVAARHFAQSPDLYGPIEMLNPETAKVVSAFEGAARDVSAILTSEDQAAFDGLFATVRAYFGDFTEEALEQSGFLIDRLVELSTGRASERMSR
jgi:chorismate mutase / prephenate dehydrogenase